MKKLIGIVLILLVVAGCVSDDIDAGFAVYKFNGTNDFRVSVVLSRIPLEMREKVKYKWSLKKPQGSEAHLSESYGKNNILYGDLENKGDYILTLKVMEGEDVLASRTRTIEDIDNVSTCDETKEEQQALAEDLNESKITPEFEDYRHCVSSASRDSNVKHIFNKTESDADDVIYCIWKVVENREYFAGLGYENNICVSLEVKCCDLR